MAKKIITNVVPYVPREHNEIYIYIQRKKNLLTPIPYKYKPCYKYLLPLIPKQNDKARLHTN